MYPINLINGYPINQKWNYVYPINSHFGPKLIYVYPIIAHFFEIFWRFMEVLNRYFSYFLVFFGNVLCIFRFYVYPINSHFGVFLGYFGYFLPILWPKTHFYTPFLSYMNFTNIFVKSKYNAKPTKNPGKWAESKFHTNWGGIYEK